MEDFLPQTATTTETKEGHEANRLAVRGLVIFAVALVVVTIFVELILVVVMQSFEAEDKSLRALTPPQFKDQAGLFPAPRLQADPASELTTFKQEELSRLNGYGWVDERAGIAHIPIERAIEILARQGLPAGSDGTKAQGAAPGTPASGAAERPAADPERKP